jgi:Tol biopolymer transport system component
MTIVRLTNGGNIHNATLSPDGKYFAYTELDGLVARLFLRQVAGGQPVLLVPELETIITGLTFAPDGQALYFVMVDRSNPLGALYRVPTKGGVATKIMTLIVSPVAFAPDGQRIAFIRLAEDGNKKTTSLVLADHTGSHEQVLLTRSGPEQFGTHGPSWSPDGKEIACQLWYGLTGSSDVVWRVGGVNVQSAALRLLTDQQWDGCGRLVWLRDGRGLVMVGTKLGESDTTARDTVWLISQPDGVPRRITTDLSRHFYSSLGMTADGQSLLVVPFNRTSQIWSVAAQEREQQIHFDAGSAKQLTTGTSEGRAGIVSLDDGHLVYVARTGEHVDLWRMRDDGNPPQQLTTEPPFLEEVSAPPDGRYYVFASKHAGRSHLFRVNQAGGNLQQVTHGESREIDSDCSPDGRWIVYASLSHQLGQYAKYRLWKIPAAGGVPSALTEHEANSPHFSPDGQWISYVYQEAPGQWRVSVISAETKLSNCLARLS